MSELWRLCRLGKLGHIKVEGSSGGGGREGHQRDKHRKEVVHLTDKKAAPVKEQPSNQSPNDTALTLQDAIRLACYANRIDHDVAECIVGGVFARYRPKPDLEDIIRTIEPEARTQRFLSVYEPWPRRTLAEALKIASSLISEFGGSMETVRFSNSPMEGCVKVTACGTVINIYFQDVVRGMR